MDFQNDPELEKLFKDELDERAGSLAAGARAMAAGELTPEIAGKMLREGHTIKGTGRVMGYEGIARGGETSEFVWRWVQQGDLVPSSMLARTLEHLAHAIPSALSGDTTEISVAIDTVRALISDQTLVDQLPEPIADDHVADDAPADVVADDEAVVDDAVAESSNAASEDDSATEPEVIEVIVEPVDPQAGLEGLDAAVDLRDEPATALPTDDESNLDTAAREPGIESLDQDDVADVAATLDQIEREIDEAAAKRADAPSDTAANHMDVHNDRPEDQPSNAGDETTEPTPAVETAIEPEFAAEPTAPTEAEGASDARDPGADDGPLVFEPGPDGKLPTPIITYEIVTSAFADAPAAGSASHSAGHDEPPSLKVVDTGTSALDPDAGASYDLGGLVGAVETWATEESVPVNAGRLFRMINDVAALRIDLESSIAQAGHLIQAAEGVSAAAMAGSLESLETVRRATVSLETAALGLTTMPLSGVTSTLPQLTKYLAKRVGRDIELVVEGDDTPVDRQLVDRIGEIIRQLVVNAVAHGIEPVDQRAAAGKSSLGMVKVSLSRNDEHVQIVVTDDGAGIDWHKVRDTAVAQGLVEEDPTTEELRSVLYSAGFSTSPGQTEFTGDGEGLARVTEIVEQVFGTMTLDSTPGRGTTFVITMPAHRALQSAQVFSAGGRAWGIPASSVTEVLGLPAVSISVTERGSFISHGDQAVPYSSFATVVGLDVEGLPSQVMVIQSPTGPIALAVDDVTDLRQVATKDLSPILSGSTSVVSGVALLGGGETVMLVDAGRLADKMREIEIRPEGPVHSVLVVDDSQGVRQVVSGVLASHGFSTLSAGSVSDALAVLSKHHVDALVVDFSMPRADGVALIHMVRQRYGDIPVVMLSGVANEEDRTRAERAGADAFFDKADFAKGALVEKLRELVDAEPTNAEAGLAS
jgi:chemotaxis protein histidine kinase CheA